MKLWRLDFVHDDSVSDAPDGSRYYQILEEAEQQAARMNGYLCDWYPEEVGELFSDELEALLANTWPQLSAQKIVEQLRKPQLAKPIDRAKRQLQEIIDHRGSKARVAWEGH